MISYGAITRRGVMLALAVVGGLESPCRSSSSPAIWNGGHRPLADRSTERGALSAAAPRRRGAGGRTVILVFNRPTALPT